MTKASPRVVGDAASTEDGGPRGQTRDGLRMTRKDMLDLARRTAEHLVARVDGLARISHQGP